MNNDNLNNNNNNFSDIPSLDDVAGLEAYLNNENLKNMGLPGENGAGNGTDGNPNNGTQDPNNLGQDPNNVGTGNQGLPNTSIEVDGVSYTPDQIKQLIANVNALNARLQQNMVQNQNNVPQGNVNNQNVGGYTAQQRQFINAALNKGYSMEQIMAVLNKNSAQSQINQRLDSLEQYLKQQEYNRAEAEFIGKLTNFGDKWGLSEQDLVTFGKVALTKGINIAMVSDLDAVFRAVYPEQYAIRSQRMNNTNTSQIYGGTNISENNRISNVRAEDAYVDAFFKHTMPNQYNKFKK